MLLANSKKQKKKRHLNILSKSSLLSCPDYELMLLQANFQFYFMTGRNLVLTCSNMKLPGLSFIIINGNGYFK